MEMLDGSENFKRHKLNMEGTRCTNYLSLILWRTEQGPVCDLAGGPGSFSPCSGPGVCPKWPKVPCDELHQTILIFIGNKIDVVSKIDQRVKMTY